MQCHSENGEMLRDRTSSAVCHKTDTWILESKTRGELQGDCQKMQEDNLFALFNFPQ
jgi:hypothetical protein